MRGAVAAVALAVSVLAAAVEARAADIRVPGDFRDLQEALVAAQPGDRVLVRGTHRGPFGVLRDGVEIVGSPRARLVGVRGTETLTGLPALAILGDGSAVRGITFVGGGLEVLANGVIVEGCTFRRLRDTRRTTFGISVRGSGAVVTGNSFGRETSTFAGIRVEGTSAAVEGNRLSGRHMVYGIAVIGEGATVTGNEVLLGRVGPGIQPQGITVDGAGAVATSNIVENGDFTVFGDEAVVEGNEISGSGLGFAGVFVDGDDGSIRFNRVRDGLDTGLVVRGDRNSIQGNEVTGVGSRYGDERFGHGVVVRGSDNRLVLNTVRECLGEGFRIAGGTGNSVEECLASGALVAGLANRAAGTTVIGSTFVGNDQDVLDAGEIVLFEDNHYLTGGPEDTGSGDPAVPDVAGPDNYETALPSYF